MVSIQEQDVSLTAYDQYMRSVRWMPHLQGEEEAQLLWSIRHGKLESLKKCPDNRVFKEAQQARDRLVEGYQYLMISLAKRFARHCHMMELLDFVQEGNLGLLQALENYDATKGEATFRTFAFCWIRCSMLAAFWQSEGAIRLPQNKVRAMKQMGIVNTRLLTELGYEPTIAETAQAMGLSEREVCDLIVLQAQQVISLYLPLDEDGETMLADAIVDPVASSFADDGFTSVEDVFKHLTHREQVVVKLRYGIEDGYTYTQREVADLLGVALTTIQMVDRRARMRLRRVLEEYSG
jgi:RNA polymerase primary sigma factor